MKLIIEIEFDHELTDRAQMDIKRYIQDFKEELEHLGGKIKKAELSKK